MILFEEFKYVYHSIGTLGLIGVTSPKNIPQYTLKAKTSFSRNPRYVDIAGNWTPTVCRVAVDFKKAQQDGITFHSHVDDDARWGKEAEEVSDKIIPLSHPCVVKIKFYPPIRKWRKLWSNITDRDFWYRGFNADWVRGDYWTAYEYFEEFANRFASKMDKNTDWKWIASGQWQQEIEPSALRRQATLAQDNKKVSLEWSRKLQPYGKLWAPHLQQLANKQKLGKLECIVDLIAVDPRWIGSPSMDHVFNPNRDYARTLKPNVFLFIVVNGKECTYIPEEDSIVDERFSWSDIYGGGHAGDRPDIPVVLYGQWKGLDSFFKL
jgi:hypothetical protein